jgi:hypothetical protein
MLRIAVRAGGLRDLPAAVSTAGRDIRWRSVHLPSQHHLRPSSITRRDPVRPRIGTCDPPPRPHPPGPLIPSNSLASLNDLHPARIPARRLREQPVDALRGGVAVPPGRDGAPDGAGEPSRALSLYRRVAPLPSGRLRGDPLPARRRRASRLLHPAQAGSGRHPARVRVGQVRGVSARHPHGGPVGRGDRGLPAAQRPRAHPHRARERGHGHSRQPRRADVRRGAAW